MAPSWSLVGSVIAVILPILLAIYFTEGDPSLRTVDVELDPGFNVTNVISQALHLAAHSWEYGTAAEALLELENPELSIFGANPFPEGKLPAVKAKDVHSLQWVKPFILTGRERLCEGDGSSTDPASLGPFALLLGQNEAQYLTAAHDMVNTLMKTVPRFWNGAISHRDKTAEVWGDFVYMVPPFLAYYAVATNDAAYLSEAVRQCKMHRQVLLANETNIGCTGLWHHFVGEKDFKNLGLWSTSNGWAAAGMVRVLATIRKWGGIANDDNEWRREGEDLVGHIKEIIDCAMRADKDGSPPLLRNNLDEASSFGEGAGTALITSAIYRMAVLEPRVFGQMYLDWADVTYDAVRRTVSAETGLMRPVIDWSDFRNWKLSELGTSEGQSFAILMSTARRDCVHAGICFT